MSEAKKSTRSAKRIIDVAHPGKSVPSASSRPVIVTNRPILKDPMMREEDNAVPVLPGVVPEVSREVTVKAVEATAKNDVKTIAQLAEEAKARVDKAEAEKAAAAKPKEIPKPKTVASTKDAEETEKPTPKASEEAKTADKSESSEASDTSTPGAEAAADEDAKLAEESKHDVALEKLVETREFFLPINAVEKRRTKRFVALGIILSLVLAVAWADIALDAGIIQMSGVKPVTHFFSN